jgi:hypothetical protein
MIKTVFLLVACTTFCIAHPTNAYFADHRPPSGTFEGMGNWIDFDHDGDLDYVGERVSNTPPYHFVSITWNNLPGEWTYDFVWEQPGGDVRLEGAEAYDFDGDGDFDILVLLREVADYAFIWLEQTTPLSFTYHFISEVDEDFVTQGLHGSGEFHIADIDSDGTMDFVCVEEVWFDMISPNRIITPILIENRGNGEITLPTDLNDDGDLDFFTINFGSKIYLFQYDDNYQFIHTRLDDEESVNPYSALISGDYDTDGDIDAMVYREDPIGPPFLPNKPLVFLNEFGSFAIEEPFGLEQWSPMGIVDGNDDGINDLLVRTNSGDESFVWLRIDDGMGGNNQYFVAEGSYSKPISADLDHDGDLDLLRGGILWYENLLYNDSPIEMDVRWDPNISPINDQLIEFDFILANYDQTRTGAIWVDAVTPAGTFRLHYYQPTMHPGQFMVLRSLQQQVPLDLPAGDYEYIVSVGMSPGNILDSDTLFFYSAGVGSTNSSPPILHNVPKTGWPALQQQLGDDHVEPGNRPSNQPR